MKKKKLQIGGVDCNILLTEMDMLKVFGGSTRGGDNNDSCGSNGSCYGNGSCSNNGDCSSNGSCSSQGNCHRNGKCDIIQIQPEDNG